MPKKEKIDESIGEGEEEMKDKPEVEDDAFKAGASGKFDEPLEARGKEATPADAPVESANNDDADLVDSEPVAPPPDDFDFSPPKQKSGSKKIFWVIIILVLLGVGIAGGFFIFKNGMPGTSATPSPEPTVQATPTPMPELDRQELNIQVQNGSGVPGAAGEAQTFLEELGYTVGGAKNAASYDYEETEIMLKEGKMDYKEQLIKDLSQKYTVSDNVEILDEGSKFDAIVIIGEKRGGE